MRGLYLFVGGIVIGLGVQMAIAQKQNVGIVGLNHVGLSVPDLDAALNYYTEILGFPEVLRVDSDSGEPVLVYVQVSPTTFVELQPANESRPVGFTHFGLQVEDMDSVTSIYKSRGANVADIHTGNTKAILSDIIDPNGIRIELVEFPPESLQSQVLGL